MKCHYDIYPDRRLILMRYAGEFTLAELTDIARKLWADKRYSKAYNGVIDLTDSKVKVGREDFQALVEFVAGHKHTSEGRWAAVASSPLATACGMIYKRAVARRHAFEVFSTFEAAGAFVGIDLDEEPFFAKAMA